MPGRVFAVSGSDAAFGPRTLRLRVLALLTRAKAPSLVVGVAVAASVIVAETLVVCSLNVVTGTTGRFGTMFLLGGLVVSGLCGFGVSPSWTDVVTSGLADFI